LLFVDDCSLQLVEAHFPANCVVYSPQLMLHIGAYDTLLVSLTVFIFL